MDTGHVTSADGTVIGFHRLGAGPGLVVLHGQMESARSHLELAEALAGTYTVYLPDRRGRGLSGPYGPHHVADREAEDLEALLAHTGASRVFAVSVGALVALHTAARHRAGSTGSPKGHPGGLRTAGAGLIRELVLYEPALFVDGPAPTAWLERYERELAAGRDAAALITAMKAARLGPAIFDLMPRRLLDALSARMLAAQDRKAGDGDVTMRMLAPTLRHETRVVAELARSQAAYGAVGARTLLLGGSRSPAYFKAALDALERVVPGAARVELAGVGHSGSGNADTGGRPERVAAELRRFFG
ncbi:alpha/beta fold hydrolase [Nonomuraea ceibae]|uniref:alpha/beta fold hydrolase n=1 Tax=Nonomuraea ceibae TaxID=1935170 RepID=UPI001C5FD50D|nr:alpha/beta hydrolase [Nonomuraea ceibae]